MNQQLLNINTVINNGNNINTSLNIGQIDTTDTNDFNNPLRLEKITTIVNNSNTSNASNAGNASEKDKNESLLKYKIIRYLGRGIQGNLYLAVDSKGHRVICKEIQLDSDPSNNAIQTKQLEFELSILKYLSSNTVAREHINPCLDYKIHQDHVYTIFPVFRGYSLGHFHGYMLKLQTQDTMQNTMQDSYYKIVFFLIKSLLHALAKIHDAGIAHQNITPNSILVSTFIEPDEIKVKFTDFGLGCGCPKDPTGNYRPSIHGINNAMISWQQYKLGDKLGDKLDYKLCDKISDCKENGHAPVKYMNEVLTQLKDSDYLKISQKYDILCIGLIILKYLLYFDSELVAFIENLFSDNMNNSKLQILRDKIKGKYFDNNSLNDVSYISNADTKLIREYLKFIWKYMISPTTKRRTAQYVIDKIIIYEKYKNDIF